MRLLFCTAPPDRAPDLVRALLEERLIGCGNVLAGARSLYWWEGEIQDDSEAVILMETPVDRAESAMARLAELHPYEVPKIIAIDPADVAAPYLQWLRSVTPSP